MGTVFEFIESSRRFHNEHDLQNHRKNRLLVTNTNGKVRLALLSDLAEGSAQDSSEIHSLILRMFNSFGVFLKGHSRVFFSTS